MQRRRGRVQVTVRLSIFNCLPHSPNQPPLSDRQGSLPTRSAHPALAWEPEGKGQQGRPILFIRREIARTKFLIIKKKSHNSREFLNLHMR